MKEDHERIWLQNAEDAAAIGASREWCSAPVWPDDPEDSEPTEYVRADLVAAARAEARRAALEEAAKVAEEWSYTRSGGGDNAFENIAAAIRALIERESEEG